MGKFLIVLTLSAFVSCVGRAAEIVAAEPSGKISNDEALKVFAKGETAWKCRKSKRGPNLKPVAVTGSKPTFHAASTKIEGVDNPFELLEKQKTIYVCDLVEGNMDSGGTRKSVAE